MRNHNKSFVDGCAWNVACEQSIADQFARTQKSVVNG